MLRRLYTVYDNIAKESAPIFESKNDNIALRQFQKLLLNTEQQDPTFNRTDYTLYVLGTMNKDTMEITLLSAPNIVTPNLEEGENE